MWYMMFICLFITALIFTLISFYMRFGIKTINLNSYGYFILIFVVFVLLSTTLWFLLSAACIEIEFPYTAIKTDDTVMYGTHTWGDSTAVSLMYLFMLFGVIQIIFGLCTVPFYVWDYFKRRYMKKERSLTL